MKTKSAKALDACMEYDRLMLAIKRNTEEISEIDCDRIIETGELEGYGNVVYIPDGKKTHLAEVFDGYIADDGTGNPEKFYYTEKEAIAILDDCSGCLKAYNAVQARKANKKAFGIVKRKIRAIGRAAK